MGELSRQSYPHLSDAAWAIFERSAEEALGSGLPECLDNEDGTIYLLGSRSQAMAFFAGELGCRFIDVRATRAWMTIDLDAIADRAHDLANDIEQGYDVEEDTIAYTWEGEGWMWRHAKRGEPGAVGFWLCEERARVS
jgi:hypothetical protein